MGALTRVRPSYNTRTDTKGRQPSRLRTSLLLRLATDAKHFEGERRPAIQPGESRQQCHRTSVHGGPERQRVLEAEDRQV